MIPVRARIGLIALAGFFIVLYGTDVTGGAKNDLGPGDVGVAISLLIALILVQIVYITLPFNNGSFGFAVSAPIMIATTITFGLVIGIGIVLLGLAADEIQNRRNIVKSLTNIGTYALATSGAGFVYLFIADASHSPISTATNISAAVLAAVVYALLGSGSFALVVSKAVGQRYIVIWKSVASSFAIEVVSIPTIGSLVVILANENAIAVLLLLLPLLAPQLAYRTLQRAQRNIRETIESLADAIERRDRYTANHSARVAGYTRSILDHMPEIPDQLAETIMAAARVHDVGKVGIKDSTLLKPGPLTVEERLDLQSHTVVGAEIVARIAEYRLCASIIRHHHERWDGGGYPDGLSGTDIPIGARIICVADAFDAMTSDRPYRRAMSAEAAIEEVRRNAGGQFDPNVVAAFERVMEIAPQPQPEIVTAPYPQANPTFVG